MSGAPRLEAVLLAAGAGARLGRPKALLEIGGVWTLPLLVRALAEAGAARVHVVLRQDERDEVLRRGLPEPAQALVNSEPARGRGGSVALGLAALPQGAAALIHPCDVPLLSPAAARHLTEAWRGAPARDGLAARLVSASGRGGHPLLLGSERVIEARALSPGSSLRHLLHADPARRLDVPWRGDPGPFLDVDTPDQLRLIESLLPGR